MRFLFLCCLTLGVFAQVTGDLTQGLGAARQRIDRIDDQIVKLLNERAGIVREVGVIKVRFHAPAEAPGRYEQVLRRVSSQAKPPLAPENVWNIYAAIVAEMTAMEKSEMSRRPASGK
jgi:chorismate mutase/prephenate dehydratase